MGKVLFRHLSGSKASQVEEYPLQPFKEFTIGRDPSSAVHFDPAVAAVVARQHARIVQSSVAPVQFQIFDLSGGGSTFVNRQRIFGAAPLMAGDVVQFGVGGPEVEFDLEPRPASSSKPSHPTEVQDRGQADTLPLTRYDAKSPPARGTGPIPGNAIGPYQVNRKLGEGAMGEVYLALDTMLDREVALKMLRPDLAKQPQLVERFRAEARMLAQLHHPNIAAVHAMLRDGDALCMVMENVPGRTLDDRLRREGPIPLGEAITLFCQVLDGVEHAHAMGIVHRDLKPANLMLTPKGELKVLDFGIARALGTARMTSTGRAIGTLEYMSPEQVRGEEPSNLSDVYSLAIVLYEMLTGRIPFNSESEFKLMRSQLEEAPPPPRQFAPWIPKPVEQAILKALAKQPEQRFQSAGEFRMALLAAVGTGAAGPVAPKAVPSATRVAGYPASEPASRKAGSGPVAQIRLLAIQEIAWISGQWDRQFPQALHWLRKYNYMPLVAGFLLILATALALWRPSTPKPTPEVRTAPVTQPVPAPIAPPVSPEPAPVEPVAASTDTPPPQPAPEVPAGDKLPKQKPSKKGLEKATDFLNRH